MKSLRLILFAMAALLFTASGLLASEADLAIPDLHAGKFPTLGGISAWNLLFFGAMVIAGTLGISLYLRNQVHKLPAHRSMLDVSEIIYQTCKTYLIQQGRFLLILFVIIALAISYFVLGFGHDVEYVMTDRIMQELRLYPEESKRLPDEVLRALELLQNEKPVRSTDAFIGQLKGRLTPDQWTRYGDTITSIAAPIPIAPVPKLLLVLLFSVVGMGGSYWVAWYGIRVNTYANCRHRLRLAQAASRGIVVNIPLRAGMSVGLFLISLELVMMVIILLFVPRQIVGYLLPRLRHRRIARRFGAAHRRRHLHQDRRHRLRPDEDRVQCQGRRPPQPRRHRRLHRRQRRRFGRADRRRLRDLRRDRRGPDRLHHPGRHDRHGLPDIQAKLIVWIFAMRFLMDFMSGVVVLHQPVDFREEISRA